MSRITGSIYGSIYRARMRLLHRFDLCWMQPGFLRSGDNGQWINFWCHWCGVRGRRLDMSRALNVISRVRERGERPVMAEISPADWDGYARGVEAAHREGLVPPLPPGPLCHVLWHERYTPEGCRCSLCE